MAELVSAALVQQWARRLDRIIMDYDQSLPAEMERTPREWRYHDPQGFTNDRWRPWRPLTAEERQQLETIPFRTDAQYPAQEGDPAFEWRLGKVEALDPLRELLRDLWSAMSTLEAKRP